MNDALVTSLVVKKIILETEDAKSFILEPVTDTKINYRPGQFLTFVFNGANGKEERRNYSISSIPGEDTTITVKRIPNGEYSRYFFDRIQEGDLLRTIGPSGFFTLPEPCPDQFVFFAAGSGITPIFALIKSLLRDDPFADIVLVYSNRSLANAIFFEQLQELRILHPQRLKIEFLFSDAAHVENKRLGIYVLEKLLEKYLHNQVAGVLFYLCGPFEYMRMITIILRNNGVPAAHIRKETFTVEIPDHKPQPPDKDVHSVLATLQGKKYRFKSQYPQTILQSAKALQIPLPYSCEAGQCGTCAATCISGEVWMWRNDVLLEEEMAKGRVLTCTGYAIGGDVEIVF